MVAANLLASLLNTNNLCTSICLNINDGFRVILYAITLVVSCRLSDMRSPLRGWGYMFPCSSEINWLVPLFPQILFSYVRCSNIMSLFPSKLAFLPLFPWNKCHFPLFTKTPANASYAPDWKTRSMSPATNNSYSMAPKQSNRAEFIDSGSILIK